MRLSFNLLCKSKASKTHRITFSSTGGSSTPAHTQRELRDAIELRALYALGGSAETLTEIPWCILAKDLWQSIPTTENDHLVFSKYLQLKSMIQSYMTIRDLNRLPKDTWTILWQMAQTARALKTKTKNA